MNINTTMISIVRETVPSLPNNIIKNDKVPVKGCVKGCKGVKYNGIEYFDLRFFRHPTLQDLTKSIIDLVLFSVVLKTN
ncbi:hypothetical protein RIR_jg13978.t1 [Rhizophagus irregularis DAOM 181602=DAOM 197198]|nr:hypothetical protein RIR_jg13978.t1 [Rhizophagus irregularis DAOM 181602=DAOM 197198]